MRKIILSFMSIFFVLSLIVGCSNSVNGIVQKEKSPPPELSLTLHNDNKPVVPNSGDLIFNVNRDVKDIVVQEIVKIKLSGKSLEMDSVPVTKKSNNEYSINTKNLSYDKTYSITAVNSDEDKAYKEFTTIKPVNKTALIGDTIGPIGNGSLLRLRFDEPIVHKDVAEKSLSVKNKDGNEVVGAWRWSSDNKSLQFRPQNPWLAGDDITITGDIVGKQLGKFSLYGENNFEQKLSVIKDTWKVVVNDSNKHATFWKNGKVVLNAPVSLGKSGYGGALLTPSGKYVVAEKLPLVLMSSAPGTPEGYKGMPVEWASRISSSGIYFHSAPWSVAQQGVSNESHGCINMSPQQAKWVVDNLPSGTIVQVNSTGSTLPITDGLGYWNGSLEQFKTSGE